MHIIMKVVPSASDNYHRSTCLDWCSVSNVPYIDYIIAQLNNLKIKKYTDFKWVYSMIRSSPSHIRKEI